jgi:ABC-type glutathione transport system ATPase component
LRSKDRIAFAGINVGAHRDVSWLSIKIMKKIMGAQSSDLIVMRGVCQRYFKSGQNISVLTDVSFILRRGSTCAIVGGSGSGKSTLLNILGLLERPACGGLNPPMFFSKTTKKDAR